MTIITIGSILQCTAAQHVVCDGGVAVPHQNLLLD